MRALSLVLVGALVAAPLTQPGCAFAVHHPAVTAGILGGVVGLTTCELETDFDEHGTCALIGGGAAALLGAVAGVAILLGGEGNTVLQEPMPAEEPILRRKKPAPAPAQVPEPAPVPAPGPTTAPVPAPDPAPAAPAPAPPSAP